MFTMPRYSVRLLALVMLALLAPGTAHAEQSVRLLINGRTLNATLADNPAARDFHAMLPLRLPLEDFHATEKISDLPKRLSPDGAPDGFSPVRGDLAYYAPWGNLAIFYQDYSWSSRLIYLGHITSDMSALADAKNGDVLVIERAD